MTSSRKQDAACWTCRLRHKRCDAVRPTCGSCRDLEITCYSDAIRPVWMDGGERQKNMANKIKNDIKRNALVRRQNDLLGNSSNGAVLDVDMDYTVNRALAPESALLITKRPSNSVFHIAEHNPIQSTTTYSSATTFGVPTTDSSSKPSQNSQHAFADTKPDPSREPRYTPALSRLNNSVATPSQLGTIMIYLDFVFPFLFPFYQPSLMETGRQWLLSLLCRSDGSLHLACALSAYFFSLSMQHDEQGGHDECHSLVWNQLIEEMEMALKSIQTSVFASHNIEESHLLLEKLHLMEEIAQLLFVELTVRNNADWTVHTIPALAIFDELFQEYGLHGQEPSMAAILRALPSSIPSSPPHDKPLPYSLDQSAVIFFISLVLFIDTIASTSLGRAPTLHKYHRSLLSANTGGDSCVQLGIIAGCDNWVITVIGDISALTAQKRFAIEQGNFSVIDFVNMASFISHDIDEGLIRLDTEEMDFRSQDSITRDLRAYYTRNQAVDRALTRRITRIWAHAAKIYLSVALSGWQMKSDYNQNSVSEVLRLIQRIDSPAQLQRLSWPICIAGCLALPNQETEFHAIVQRTDPMRNFGTLSSALQAMEAVWASRDDRGRIEGDIAVIASFLNMLGSPLLLI